MVAAGVPRIDECMSDPTPTSTASPARRRLIFSSRHPRDFDKAPWHINGVRIAEPLTVEDVRDAVWDPRAEFEPTRDQLPWTLIDSHFGFVLERYRTREAAEAAIGRTPDFMLIDAELSVLDVEWDPRPEFARAPVNPMLARFRRISKLAHGPVKMARVWLGHWDSVWHGDCDADEREHCRRVLEKLAVRP